MSPPVPLALAPLGFDDFGMHGPSPFDPLEWQYDPDPRMPGAPAHQPSQHGNGHGNSRFTFNSDSQRAGGQSVRDQRQVPYDVNENYAGTKGSMNAEARAAERHHWYGMMGGFHQPFNPRSSMPGPMRHEYRGGMPPLPMGLNRHGPQLSPSPQSQSSGSPSTPVYANGRPTNGRFTFGPESQIGGGMTAIQERRSSIDYAGQGRQVTRRQLFPSPRSQRSGSPSTPVYTNGRSTKERFTYGPESQIGGGTFALERRVQQHNVQQHNVQQHNVQQHNGRGRYQ